MGGVIVPIPITVRPRALTAWHFTDVSQGPEFATLTRGTWDEGDPNCRPRPEPCVWFTVGGGSKRRLTVGDYLVRDSAANFRVVGAAVFEHDYDSVVPGHPASLLALAREVLAMEFEPAEDAVAWLRRLLRVRHPDDPCGTCQHPRFSHRGLHGVYGSCSLCDRPGAGCADYIDD